MHDFPTPDFSHLFPSDARMAVADSLGNQPKLVASYHLFRGDSASPLLAPRGIYLSNNWLFVADTGQNRVFGWHGVPTTEFAPPTLVLGQMATDDTGRNAGHQVTAQTLQYPSGIWTDGTRLAIADAWNHRVLLWHQMPTQHGQAADVVLGQPSFEQNEPNVAGLGSQPTAQSLNWPYGVCSDGQHLWIADTGNRRVLFYENWPTQNYQAADKVIGKTSFNDRDYESNDAIWPYAVRVSAEGQLCIADTQLYRHLLWHNWQDAFSKPADTLIGQPDFDACGQNQFSLFPKQNSLSWTYDSCFYKEGIWIADTGNSRLLWFDQLPTQHAAEATNVLGHPHFQMGSENANTRFGTDKQLYWPFSLCIEGHYMAVADTGNHRVVIYKLAQ